MAPPFSFAERIRLHRRQVLSGGPLLALNHFEFNRLAFAQGAEAFGLNDAVVHEDVVTAFPLDEAIAFSIVEPFHGSGYAVSNE